MIYVILGMHKAGTTLVAEMLHKSGINMGDFDESVNYDSGNQYERKESFELNIAMLGCGNDISFNLTTPLKEDVLDKSYDSQIKDLIANLNNRYKDWGFKDPRTCLTYGAWRKHLPEHQIIFVYRSPLEVWSHYQRRISSINLIRILMVGWKTIAAWYIYNKEAFKYVEKNKNRSFLVEYSKLMQSNKELRRLENYLDRKLHDSRNNELYRSRFTRKRLYDLITWVQSICLSRNASQLYKQINKFNSSMNTTAEE